VLAAPGSNDYRGLLATSTTAVSRADGTKFQELSNKEANELCEQHIGLAYNIAERHLGKGIKREELRAASLLGLVQASRNFNPKLGIPFWGFAQHRTEGAVKDLFRPGKYGPDYPRKESLNAPIVDGDGEETGEERVDLLSDDSGPALSLDLSELTPKERTIIEARNSGESLQSVGYELGLSAERIRQIEAQAQIKLRKRETDDPVRISPGDKDAREFCNEYNAYHGNFRELRRRKSYQAPSHHGWAKAIEDARFAEHGPFKQIKITKHLSGEERRKWTDRLRNAEATDWGRHSEDSK